MPGRTKPSRNSSRELSRREEDNSVRVALAEMVIEVAVRAISREYEINPDHARNLLKLALREVDP